MAVMDLQVTPRRIGTVSVSDAVAEAQRVIEASGLKYMLHPMGTCVEGAPDELYALAARIHQALALMGFDRIGMNLKLDDRRDRPQTMEDKLRRISELTGKTV
jgi:uncharacterized protein (TIGR00106 family)